MLLNYAKVGLRVGLSGDSFSLSLFRLYSRLTETLIYDLSEGMK